MDIFNTFTVSYEESKMVSFASSVIKNIVLPFIFSTRFPVKLICCIASGSTSSACYLLKSIVIMS